MLLPSCACGASPPRRYTADRVGSGPEPLRRFRAAKAVQKRYMVQLAKIARQINDLVRGFGPSADPARLAKITAALQQHSLLIRPWAKAVGERMITEVSTSNLKEWRTRTAEMGTLVREEIEHAPTGHVMREGLARQVDLITSLPREAAERVHRLAQSTLSTGVRPAEVAAEILRTGDVSAARARLIARTEVGRAQVELTRARAESIGSVGYLWRTARDVDVRQSHRDMADKYVRWDSPPTLDGLTGHAGQLPNCRCDSEPILPNE